MRRNVASQVVSFQMLLATDGSDVTTGTPTVYYTIDGGTQGTGAGTSTHEGNGQWSYVPAQAETNGDHVAFTMVLATAISQTVNVYPVSYDYTDAVRLGLTSLPNAAADAAGGLPISDAGGFDVDAINTQLADIPTVAEFEARTILAASYFDPAADTVANVTTVGNMRGTDSAALATALATAQTDLDTITGTDGVTLATAQALYAPLKPTVAGRDVNITAAGLAWSDVQAISGDSVAASNLELQYDGTGLSGATFPATQAAVTTAQTDLDTITGTDGVTLATAQALYAPLKPTTAGRTLDVTTTGEAGIDLANVNGVLSQANVGWVDSNSRVDVGSWIGNAVTASSTTSKPEVDLFSISDDSTAANNLELQYDTTGYTDPTAPASRSQVASIGVSTGAGLNFAVADDNTDSPIQSVTFVGSQGATAFANTESENAIYHSVEDTATAIDLVYQFSVGARVAVQAVWKGYVAGVGDQVTISAYDWIGTDWEILTTLDGQSGTDNTTRNISLLGKHSGTSANAGLVLLRFESANDTVLNTDQILIEATVANQTVGYSEGAIWVNTNASNTNTTPYVDGTADNPVSSWAAALTLSTSLSIDKFHIGNGSSITLTGTSDNFEIYGQGWSLALGSRSIDGAAIRGATVTGIGEATSTKPLFEDCLFGTVTCPPANLKRCGIGNGGGTFTAASAGQFVLERCYSVAAGTGTPTMDFSGNGVTTGINVRGWLGGSTYTLDSNCKLSHEVLAGGTTAITANGAPEVEVRGVSRLVTLALTGSETVQCIGTFGDITLSGTTSVAASVVNVWGVSDGVADSTAGLGATVTDQSVSRANINAEADTALADYDGPTKAELDSGLAALNDIAATDILSDGTALNTTAGVLDVVNLANTTTTNTDMRGTDSAALATALATAQSDLDTITGSDGVTLATTQGNYAPATATAMAAAQTDLDTITDTGVTCVALTSAAITDVWSTDTLVEAYAADGAAGTPAQVLYMIQQACTESAITGSTITVKKLDGSTTAATYTLDDATTPTSRTRAT